MPVSDDKRAFGAKLIELIEKHKTILIVEATNVGSSQMQKIRMSLRGEATVLMGKNTTIRKVVNDFLKKNRDHPIRNLLDHVYGNIGFVFTSLDASFIRDKIVGNRVPAPARVGTFAPVDVYVEPGPTGCDPGQTSWFQALNIPTKINKGQIEMVSRVHLIKIGDKVAESQAALLQKLNMKPFSYGLKVEKVYDDGEVFDAAILDVSERDLLGKLSFGISYVAALSMSVGFPTKASIMHSINNAFKHLISIHLGTEYKFGRAQKFEDFLANPGNFVAAVTVTAGAKAGATAVAVAVAKESSSESVAATGGAGGLFGDSDDF